MFNKLLFNIKNMLKPPIPSIVLTGIKQSVVKLYGSGVGSMAFSGQDFEYFHGDDKTIQIFVLKDINANIRIDLTGYDVVWELTPYNSNDVLFSKTLGDGITMTDAVNGEFYITLTHSDTIESGLYSHKVKVIDSSGNVITILTGTVRIK